MEMSMAFNRRCAGWAVSVGVAALVGAVFQTAAAADAAPVAAEVIPFPNGSFDEGEAHWFFSRERGVQTRATAEYFHTAPGALRIYADADKKIMARVDSPFVPVKGPGIVEVRYKACGFAGRHLNVTVRQYDAEKKFLPIDNWSEDGDSGGKWYTGLREVLLDEKTAYIQMRFLPLPAQGETIDVFYDDFEVVRPVMPIPPWPGQYKLKPTDKLTAADVVGPDGIVYPNWRNVGVQGGIPDVPVAVKLADLGARPDTDIADILDQACREAGKKGGGAVLVGEGTFRMSHPVTVRDSGVVIRGMGKDKTKLVYDNPVGQPGADVGLYWPKAGEPAGPDTVVEAHVYNIGLKSFKMFVNDKEVATGSSNAYQHDRLAKGTDLIKLAGTGEAALRVEAAYMDGHVAKAERKLTLTDQPQAVKGSPSMSTLLFFEGAGLTENREYKLAADGKRGDTVLVLADIGDLKAGDKIDLHAPGTPRWQKIIQHTQTGDDWKRIAFDEIKAISGNRVTIGQPLRIDYPIIDGTYLRKLKTVERNGVENLAIEHLSRLPVNTIGFDWAWNGWVRNVKVIQSGSTACHGYRSQWLEFRDCEFDGAWQFDGGQAYSGFTSTHNSLYENNVVKKHRHAPVVQYGANGNVFRNSTFEDSDIQWHAGWSTENLFENCVVNSNSKHGSYGHGAYATGSDDGGHGPNGPRNVVYNCDLYGINNGVALDGVNEGWIFLHNRIVNEKGAGFVVKRGSFDHIIQDNVFVVKDANAPMALLKTPDCIGIDLIGNTLVGGNGQIAPGAAKPAVDQGNKVLPAGAPAERPKPAVPSIYEWQRKMERR
jgi:hypothetical protein